MFMEFLQGLEKAITTTTDFLWGYPLVILLFGTHIYLTVRLRFIQRYIGKAIKLSVTPDKGSRGEREDKSGPLIVEMLTAAGYQVEETMILPDEAKALKAQLIRLADGRQVNLILTTGGTGFAPRDITPEATYAVADRNAPGIAEAMRYHSLSITPRGMLSRAASVLRGKTLIVNLPGSPKAVKENLEYILPSLEHGVRIAAGLDGECARK